MLAVYLLALAVTVPLRRARGAPAGRWHEAGRALRRDLARPAAVLLLSSLAVAALRAGSPGERWLAEHAAHVTAWWLFWIVVFGVALMDTLAGQAYALRGKAFPVPGLIRNLLRALVLLAALLVILRTGLGINIAPLLASTALITAVVGFALQGVLGNLLAGMSLHITRSILPGDWLAMDGMEGRVLDTNWRETLLENTHGHRLVVPNSMVAGAVVHNMSRPTPLRRHTLAVGASYADAPAAVIEALVQSAAAVPAVAREPAPAAYITEFKDFGINYELRFWTRDYPNRTPINGDVARMIWYRFKRRGIEIPFPMSDKLLNDFMEVVYTQRRLAADDQELERRADELQAGELGQQLLADADGASLLQPAEWRTLAGVVRRILFTRGEMLFRQGEPGDTCYVLVRGRLAGTLVFDGGAAPHTFEIAPGALVGEMSLLTGLPRTATVQAVEEAELLELAPAAFTRLLGLRPEIPERLAGLVAERGRRNAAAYEQLKSLAVVDLKETLRRDTILRRFWRMLGRAT